MKFFYPAFHLTIFQPLSNQMNIDSQDNNALPKSQQQPKDEEPFGSIIHSYSRGQALKDGVQVNVSKAAREAGIRFPVYLTREVFDKYVVVPKGVESQHENARLWDLVWCLRNAIRRSPKDAERIPFKIYVRNDNDRARLVDLFASCGPKDIDDPKPAITVLLPDQD